MIIAQIRSFGERLIPQEKSPHKFALTCALGVFIGLSPFVGLHTAMTFLFAWCFSLNIAALFAVSVLINNPWTMVPVYTLDHFFGVWFFRFLHIDYMQLDPAWVQSCIGFLKEHTGITGISLTAFLAGGNVLACGLSVLMYLLVKRIFVRYYSEKIGDYSTIITL